VSVLPTTNLSEAKVLLEETMKEKDMQAISLSILAPERRLIEGEAVASVILTTSEGEVEILPGHADMVSMLETGRFVYTPRGGKPVTGVISSGFLNVEHGTVKVVAETIELVKEINLERAREAQKKAEKMLSDPTLDPVMSRKYQLKLLRAVTRQQIGAKT
jgi:F-type H+-transporting ATPase subunit epsilon